MVNYRNNFEYLKFENLWSIFLPFAVTLAKNPISFKK